MDEPSKPELFTIKFWLLLGLSIPSTICSIFIFVYFCHKRKKLSTHLRFTFLLVLISFLQITTDLPFVMLYYYRGEVAVSSDGFCLWWNWWDYSTSSLLIIAMAWGCIERYFLVFYSALLSNRRQRFIFHTVPLIVVCAYPLLFYLFVIVFNSCENTWQFDMLLCVQPCYLIDQQTLATFDFIGNIVLPVLIIVVMNICLIGRVVCNRRSDQPSWRRKRRLTVQLLYISMTYVVFWLPLTCNGLVVTFTASSIALGLQLEYFFFLVYLVPILLPFISLTYLKDFAKTVCRKRRTRVLPVARIR